MARANSRPHLSIYSRLLSSIYWEEIHFVENIVEQLLFLELTTVRASINSKWMKICFRTMFHVTFFVLRKTIFKCDNGASIKLIKRIEFSWRRSLRSIFYIFKRIFYRLEEEEEKEEKICTKLRACLILASTIDLVFPLFFFFLHWSVTREC